MPEPPLDAALPESFAAQRCFGRDAEHDGLMTALLQAPKGSPSALLITGEPGSGTSTLARAVLEEPAVVARFGDQRVAVSADAAQGAAEVSGLIAMALGLRRRLDADALLARLEERSPAILLLDGVEAPLVAAHAEMTTLLGRLAVIPGLGLIVVTQTPRTPVTIRWQVECPIAPLADAAARHLFLHLAPAAMDDAALPALLTAIGGLPLVISLMAGRAIGGAASGLSSPSGRHRASRGRSHAPSKSR